MSLLGLPELSGPLAQKVKERLILWKFSLEIKFLFSSLFLLILSPSILPTPL